MKYLPLSFFVNVGLVPAKSWVIAPCQGENRSMFKKNFVIELMLRVSSVLIPPGFKENERMPSSV